MAIGRRNETDPALSRPVSAARTKTNPGSLTGIKIAVGAGFAAIALFWHLAVITLTGAALGSFSTTVNALGQFIAGKTSSPVPAGAGGTAVWWIFGAYVFLAYGLLAGLLFGWARFKSNRRRRRLSGAKSLNNRIEGTPTKTAPVKKPAKKLNLWRKS